MITEAKRIANHDRVGMRRRNVEKETVEIDVLQKKNEELKQFVERYDSAVAVVTGTINNLKEINENIGEKIKEIEEYQTELARNMKEELPDSCYGVV